MENKPAKPQKISLRLYPDDIVRLIEGLKVLRQDLAFYEKRADEKQVFNIVAERLNCKELQRMLEDKLNKNGTQSNLPS